jgi:hypothetical protein
MIRNVNIIQCTCERCGKEFIPRTCPACKSPNWNKPASAPGRPRKVKVTMPAEEEIPPEPVIEEAPEEFQVDLQPKSRQSTVNVTPIVKERTRTPLPKPGKKKDKAAKHEEKQVAKRKGKEGYCPHNFIMLNDGGTACPQCK